jgi:hypothetical protein
VVNKGRTAMVALDGFTPLQGGVPISVDGQIVGAAGVSGAASAQQDEELAIAGAKALESGPPPVTYFPGADVKAAFAKGSVLFDRRSRRSRRPFARGVPVRAGRENPRLRCSCFLRSVIQSVSNGARER